MKVAIVGCGNIAATHAKALIQQNQEIVLVIGRDQSKAKAFAEIWNIPSHSNQFTDALASSVDCIHICTPPAMHYEMAKAALLAGKHVICEKPFTSRIEELEELSQLAKEKHLFLFEAISTQYLPNVLKIKEKLNELGNIKIVTANYSQYSSRYNAFKEGIIQPAFDYTKSGGALMDLNIYNIHLMVALFGKPLKVNYMANIEKNIDTSGIITLDYGNFKAVLIGAKDCKAPIATSIQGDQGCISIQTPANVLRSFKILHNDQREEEFDLQGDTHRMVYEFNEFVKMIENKDSDRANEMMEKSLIAMDIATKARIDAGVHFKADESYE